MISDDVVKELRLVPIVRLGLVGSATRIAALSDHQAMRTVPEAVFRVLDWDRDPAICLAAADARASSDDRGRAYDRLATDPTLGADESFLDSPHLVPLHAVRNVRLWKNPRFRSLIAGQVRSENEHLIEELARDGSGDVRRALAANNDTPDSVISRLAADHEPSVREAAKEEAKRRRTRIRSRASDHDEYGDRARWSRSVHRLRKAQPASDEELLHELALAAVDLEPPRILEQSWVPARTLRGLVSGQRQRGPVIHAVARNRSTPPDVLRNIAFGEWGSDHAEVAIQNSSLEPGTLRFFATSPRDVREREREAAWSNAALPDDLIRSIPKDQAARLGLAQNPAAPQEVLAELARGADVRLRSSVAENPGASIEILLDLARGDDRDLSYGLAKSIVGNPHYSRDVAEALATRPGARLWVAESSKTPTDLLVRLTADSDPEVRRAAAVNPSTPQYATDALQGDEEANNANRHWSIEASRQAIMRDLAEESAKSTPLPRPTSPTEAAVTFIRSMDRDSREDLATYAGPHYTVESEFIQQVLSGDPSPRVRSDLAYHCSERLRRVLAQRPGPGIIASVAWSTRDPALIAELADDPDARLGLVRNPAAPPAVLMKLAQDGSSYDHQQLAQHPYASVELLSWLSRADDPEGAIARLVAQHTRTSPETLARLGGNESAAVRQYVGAHRNTGVDTLADLSSDSDPLVRVIVAMNRNTPPRALAQLAGDPDTRVRQLIAARPDAPSSLWATLIVDSDTAVRTLADATLRPDAEKRCVLAAEPSSHPTLLDLLATDPVSEVRLAVASNGSASPNALGRLSKDPDQRVRLTLARSPDSPRFILNCLTEDRSWFVRRAARASLRQYR